MDLTSHLPLPPDSGTRTVSLLDPTAQVGRLFAANSPLDGIIASVAAEVASRSEADCLIVRHDAAGGRPHMRTFAAGPHGFVSATYAPLEVRLATLDPATATDSPWREAWLGDAVVGALDDLPAADPIWREVGVGRLMAVPLRIGLEPLGVMIACRGPESVPFTASEAANFTLLAADISRGLATVTVLAEERWQRQKAELMFQASKAIHTELQFDQAVREISLLLKQAIKAPWVGFFSFQAPADTLALLGSTFASAIDLRLASHPWPLLHWPEARVAFQQSGAPLKVSQPALLAAELPGSSGAIWIVPLLHMRAPLGLLAMTTPPDDPTFGSESQEVAVAIAELVALALSNHQLIEEEARARMQIIRAQAAAQEREVLLRQIVHDLRNATQAMSLVAEDMELGIGDNPEAQHGLGILNNQITFISNFLKEKLMWMAHGERPGHGDTARLSLAFASIDGRFGPAARAKHLRLVVSPPEPVDVAISSVQLEQVIGNLVDNAIKFTPPHGEVRIRADVSDGWVTVYVADTGPGIPVHLRPHLGEVGLRGNTSVEGAGLGLANIRQLVTRAGGLFGCTSSETTGTTFHVSLPSTLWGRVIS